MKIQSAPDIQNRIEKIIKTLELSHIDINRIKCMRSFKSKSNAYARIYAFPSVWKVALNMKPHYVIEVLSEKFDNLSEEEQDMTLIHELCHIPLSFSGALLSHKTKQFDGKGGHKTVRIDRRTVKKLYKEYKQKLYKH